MIIYPAIDIQGGKVVRLAQGKFDAVTQYSDDPLLTAKRWVAEGAPALHLVDLDGAQTGSMKNLDAVLKIAAGVKVPVQVGGGIRTAEEIKTLLDANINRIILGTKVINDREFFKKILRQWDTRIAVSVDCSNGLVTQRGWTNVTNIKGTDFAKDLEALGLKCLIYTDIKRDGMLRGPNWAGLEELLNTIKIPVIASGGIANLEDIKKLLKLEAKGVIGAITGKAIYEGTLNLKEAVNLCSQKE